MSRLDTTALNFASMLLGFAIYFTVADQGNSAFVVMSSFITLAFSGMNGFYFVRGALLYLREGEPEKVTEGTEPRAE
ncbi:hypothetical protein ABH908_000205 [Pseudomonas frederiksbergensis]